MKHLATALIGFVCLVGCQKSESDQLAEQILKERKASAERLKQMASGTGTSLLDPDPPASSPKKEASR